MAVDFDNINRVVNSYVGVVREVLPVDKVMLFGSYANGTATEQSDIDICFFLKTFGDKRRVDIIKVLLSLTHDFKGIFFEPTVFPVSELDNDNPFVKEILRTGREL
jgi:predicted nucleotidyltransferase